MTAVASTHSAGARRRRTDRRRRTRRFTTTDRIVLALMVGLPSLVVAMFVVLPAIESVILSFTDWDGIGVDTIKFIGLRNYVEIFTNYPAFCPAV